MAVKEKAKLEIFGLVPSPRRETLSVRTLRFGERARERGRCATEQTMKFDAHDRDRARELRGEMNEAEALLWARLRAKRRNGLKFRRQHPLGPFVADFYCAAAKVVVELDGATHRSRQDFDRMRDNWMAERGLSVLRFRNEEVYESISTVLRTIETTCLQRIRGPSPRSRHFHKIKVTSGERGPNQDCFGISLHHGFGTRGIKELLEPLAVAGRVAAEVVEKLFAVGIAQRTSQLGQLQLVGRQVVARGQAQ